MHTVIRLFCLLALLGACTPFPELDAAVTPGSKDAPYPDLVPLGPLLDETAAVGSSPEETVTTLEARLTLLRARAAGLRGPVLNRSERARLAENPV